MAHVRQQIRDAAVALLQGATAAGQRVFPGRVWPVGAEELPGILVYTAEEESERLAQQLAGVGDLYRAVTLRVQVTASGADGKALDDALDDLAAETEAALGAQLLDKLVKELVLVATTAVVQAEGETAKGARLLDWRAEYVTPENDPQTAK